MMQIKFKSVLLAVLLVADISAVLTRSLHAGKLCEKTRSAGNDLAENQERMDDFTDSVNSKKLPHNVVNGLIKLEGYMLTGGKTNNTARIVADSKHGGLKPYDANKKSNSNSKEDTTAAPETDLCDDKQEDENDSDCEQEEEEEKESNSAACDDQNTKQQTDCDGNDKKEKTTAKESSETTSKKIKPMHRQHAGKSDNHNDKRKNDNDNKDANDDDESVSCEEKPPKQKGQNDLKNKKIKNHKDSKTTLRRSMPKFTLYRSNLNGFYNDLPAMQQLSFQHPMNDIITDSISKLQRMQRRMDDTATLKKPMLSNYFRQRNFDTSNEDYDNVDQLDLPEYEDSFEQNPAKRANKRECMMLTPFEKQFLGLDYN